MATHFKGHVCCAIVVVVFTGLALPSVVSAQDTAGIKARPQDLAAVGVAANGSGVSVAILEGGAIDTGHPAFQGFGGVIFQSDFSGNGLSNAYHTAAVGSVIAGNGGGLAGVAPGLDYLQVGQTSNAESIAKAISTLYAGGDVVNMSFGFSNPPFNPNGQSQLTLFLDWWANTNDVVLVKSAGNKGDNGPGFIGSQTITVPGDAYNMITVGATNNANTAVASFSSEGRTADLRNKPDIVAPGSSITMANGFFRDNDSRNGDFRDDNNNSQIGLELNTFRQQYGSGVIFRNAPNGAAVNSLSIADANNDGVFTIGGDLIIGGNLVDTDNSGTLTAGDVIYSGNAFDAGDDPDLDTIQMNGTSFAAPHVAGSAALLRDFARKTANHVDDHRVIKAIMLNGANHTIQDKTGNAWKPTTPGADSLDDELGSGLLDVQNSFVNFKPDKTANPAITKPVAWDFNEIDANQTIDYVIDQQLLDDTQLTATLVWDRELTRVSDGDSDFLDDVYNLAAFANLDLILLKNGVEQINVFDALGRAAFSTSTIDPTEHIYFQLDGTANYALRVRNNDAIDNVFFGFALLSTPIPEPAGLMLAGAMTLFVLRRRFDGR